MEKVHFMPSLGISIFLSFLTRGVYKGYQALLSFWLSRRDIQHVNLGHLSVKDSGIGHGQCSDMELDVCGPTGVQWISITTENFSPRTQNWNYYPTNRRRPMTPYNSVSA